MKRVEWFWSLLWCVAVSSQPRGQPIVVISLSLLIIDYHLLSFPQFPPFFFSLPTLSHRHQFKQRRDNPLRHFIECVFVQASKRRRIRKTTAYECVAVFGQTDEKDYWDLCANTLNGSTWMLVQNTRKKRKQKKSFAFFPWPMFAHILFPKHTATKYFLHKFFDRGRLAETHRTAFWKWRNFFIGI